jgi:PAS domain S-box-containing protein
MGTSLTAASRSGAQAPKPALDPVLDAIAAVLGAGICVLDAEDRLLAWNDTYLTLFPEEADLLRPGLPLKETVRRFFETHLEPAERPFIDRHVAAALERHRNPPSSYTRQCKDGRWLSLEVRRLADGRLLKIFTDVTSRHDSGAMKEAITAVDVGLIRYAGDGTFQTANRAASVLFPALVGQFRSGSTRADHIRLLADSVLAPGEAARAERLLAMPQPDAAPREPAVLRDRDGRWLQYEERRQDDGGVVMIWQDVTARIDAKAELDGLRLRMTDAIESIHDGFVLFDAEDRLVLWNDAYRRLYGLAEGELQPGMPFRTLIETAIRRGLYAESGDVVDRMQRRLSHHRGDAPPLDLPLADGRWIRMTERLTHEGGIVGIHVDITDIKRREAALGDSERRLAATLADDARRTAMLDAIGYAATQIIGRSTWRAGIQELLARLGRATGTDRTYIFEVQDLPGGGLTSRYSYEWVAEGVPALIEDPQMHDHPLPDDPAVLQALIDERMTGMAALSGWNLGSELEQRELRRQGVRSNLKVPILFGGRWWGTMGFDDIREEERSWRADEIDVLKTAASLIGAAIERGRMDEELRRSAADLERRVEDRTAQYARVAEELQGTVADLRRTQADLVQAEKMASLAQLVAGVAHEINTPVGTALSAASHLEERARAFAEIVAGGQIRRSELERFVDRAGEVSRLLLSNLERAAALIREFKQVAVDQTSAERRTFDLATYLEGVITSLAPNYRRTPHRVTLRSPAGITMDSFPGALSQIVTNLVINALAHAFPTGAPGTVALTVAQGPEPGQVILGFADDGAGIPPETIGRIFDPFFTTKRGAGGSGLGLHIVYNLVTASLGGQITVDSTPGRGTRFTVILPLVAPGAAEGRPE